MSENHKQVNDVIEHYMAAAKINAEKQAVTYTKLAIAVKALESIKNNTKTGTEAHTIAKKALAEIEKYK